MRIYTALIFIIRSQVSAITVVGITADYSGDALLYAVVARPMMQLLMLRLVFLVLKLLMLLLLDVLELQIAVVLTQG